MQTGLGRTVLSDGELASEDDGPAAVGMIFILGIDVLENSLLRK